MLFCDGQMMKVTAPAIMPAEHGADKLRAVSRYKAHSRIALEVARHVWPGIRFIQAHSLGLAPQSVNFIEIIDGHRFYAVRNQCFDSLVSCGADSNSNSNTSYSLR